MNNRSTLIDQFDQLSTDIDLGIEFATFQDLSNADFDRLVLPRYQLRLRSLQKEMIMAKIPSFNILAKKLKENGLEIVRTGVLKTLVSFYLCKVIAGVECEFYDEIIAYYHKASARMNESTVQSLLKSFPGVRLGMYLNDIPYVRIAFEDEKPKLVQSYVHETAVYNLRALPCLGFNHPNIVNFATFDASDMVVLIMDRHSASLAQHPRIHHDSDMPRFDVLIGELLNGLSVLHHAGFAHTNIIRRNIRLTRGGHAVLAGMASVTTIGTTIDIRSPNLAPRDMPGSHGDRFVASRELDLFMLAVALLQTLNSWYRNWCLRQELINDLLDVEQRFSLCSLQALPQLRKQMALSLEKASA